MRAEQETIEREETRLITGTEDSFTGTTEQTDTLQLWERRWLWRPMMAIPRTASGTEKGGGGGKGYALNLPRQQPGHPRQVAGGRPKAPWRRWLLRQQERRGEKRRRPGGAPGRSSPPARAGRQSPRLHSATFPAKSPGHGRTASPHPRAPAGAFIPGEASSRRVPSSPPCPLLPPQEARAEGQAPPSARPPPPARRQGAVALPGRGGGRTAAGRLPPRLTPCLACSSASRCCRKASSSSSAIAAGRSRSRSADAVLRLRHRARRY